MTKRVPVGLLFLLALLLPRCSDGDGDRDLSEEPLPSVQRPPDVAARKAPHRILVDQIVISFKGAADALISSRTREQAKALAHSLLQRVRAGVRFELLKEKHTDERLSSGRAPNPFIVCNRGVKVQARGDGYVEAAYDNLNPVWRKVAFKLAPGEVGLAEYDPKHCPQGWHLIKRLQ